MFNKRDFLAYIERLAVEDKMREASRQYIYGVVHDYDTIVSLTSKIDLFNDELITLRFDVFEKRGKENNIERKRIERIACKKAYIVKLKSALFFVNEFKKKIAFLDKNSQKALWLMFFKRKKVSEVAEELNLSKRRVYQLLDSSLLRLYYSLDYEYKRMIL